MLRASGHRVAICCDMMLGVAGSNCQAPVKRFQHFKATYRNIVGPTCCARLATLLRRVATCWVLLAQI